LGVLKPETYKGQEYKPVFALAVGLMEIANLFRYAALAVGLKPSANQGKARLRGLWRIMYSKTIHPRLCEAKLACAGESGLCIQRPYTLGYARRRPPARARADYLFEDHQPAGGALLWVIVYRLFLSPTASSLIGYWLSAIGYQLSAMEGEARLRRLYP
jgi:hypothetical protein